MVKQLFRKWTIVCMVMVLVMTTSVAYATDVVIEDPTPDLTAPAINSISVSSNELTPTSPVKVTADITDDLSGFSDGYITYTKPNNQRFNVAFVYNASTKLYEADIRAASNDVAGSWKATTIFLRDKKDNTINLSHNSTQTNGQKIDFTPLHLNVSGVTPTPQPTDKEAPILHSIEVNNNKLTVNDRLQLTAEVTDNESGVASVIAYYRTPSGATKSISLTGSGNDKFVGSYTIGKYDESGEWTLTSVTTRDRVGNSKTYTSYQDRNNKTVNFNNCLVVISGTTVDKEAPVLHDISVTSRLVHPNEKIEVRAEVTDNESGVAVVRATYKKPDGSTSTIDLRRDASGQFVGSVTVGQYEERGLRTLTSVYLSDILGNNRTITSYTDNNNQLRTFEHCTVEITGTTPDWEGPEFTSGSITVKQISNIQAEVILTVGVEDLLSGVANGTLTGQYKKPSGRTINLTFTKLSGDKYKATVPIDKYDELGEYVLSGLSVRDNVGNTSTAKTLGVSPLSEFNFNVLGKITITPGTPNSISATAPSEMNRSQSHQLKPILEYSNAAITPLDITKDPLTKYTSSNPNILTVNSQGLIQVPANAGSGYATIEVTYGNVRKTMEVKVNGGATESYLSVTPLMVTMHAGQSEQIKVVEINDGERKDVTKSSSGITYTSSSPANVTVTPDGLIQTTSGAQQGTYYINMTYKGLKATTTVRLSQPVVKSLSISPTEETLSLTNNKLQLVLKALMNDGTSKDVTKESDGTKYTSSDPKRAQVDANGLVVIPRDAISGTVTIKATNSNLVVQSILTIDGNPELTGIKITTDKLSVFPGEEKQLAVVSTYSNDTTKDITASSTGTLYTSSNPARALVDTEGKVTIPKDASLGTVVITVNYETFRTTAVLNVVKDTSNDILSIEVDPATASLMPEGTQQVKVTAKMGNDTLKDITASIAGTIYTSSNTERAMVNAEGLITIPKSATAGTVVVSVKNGSFQKSITLTITNDPAKELKSISVKPNPITLYAGKEQQLSVTALMGDGSEKDVTHEDRIEYTSSIPARASVDATGLITIPVDASLGAVVITAKLGTVQSSVTVTIEPDPATVVKNLSITPNPLTLQTGEKQQLTVKKVMGDGSETDVTASQADTVYSSNNTERAVVSPEGLVSVPSYAPTGTVVITVQNKTQKSTVVITVTQNPATEIKSLAITPNPITTYPGKTQQLTVIGNMGDGSQKDMNSSEGIEYTSSNSARASVNTTGLITIPPDASLGTVVISAKIGTKQAAVTVTVEQDPSTVVKGLNITPNPLTIQTGDTQQLTVKRVMGDESETDVTASQAGTTYSSSNTERAIVSAEGLVTIPTYATTGTVAITVQNGSQKATLVITIIKNPATEIKSLALTPNPITLHAGKTQQLAVISNMGDGSQKDMTGAEGIVYTSTNPARASVDAAGLITIPADSSLGTVVITAKLGTQQTSVTVTVEQDPATVVKDLVISPNPLTLQTGETQQLTAKRVMGDGSEIDVTTNQAGTVYSSSNTDRAVVSAEGFVTIPTYASAGTVVITVKNSNKQATIVITVKKNPATEIKSMVISPDPLNMYAGKVQQLTVLGNMGDGSQQDMTNSNDIQYTSSIPARATVNATGLLTIPVDATLGTVVITATIGTSRTSVTVTVGNNPASEVKELSITPNPLTIQTGETQQLTVKMIMGDNSERDATSSATGTIYTSSNTDRAVVSAEGLVTIPTYASAGTVVITAKNDKKQSTLIITVKRNPATEIKSMVISPDPITMHAGKTQQLTVLANMGDGSQQNMTNHKDIQYTTSNPARAIVDASGQVTIPGDATLGTVVITASIGSSRTSVTVNVGKDPATEVSRLVFNPESLALQTGNTYQLSLNAVMGDGSQRDITASSQGTEYSSTILSRAIVNAEGLVTIPVSASAGTVVIVAKNGKLQANLVITVSKDLSTEVKGILVTPNNATLAVGGNLHLTVMGTMGDGSLKDITSGNGTLYTSSNVARAMIDTDGRITIPNNATLGSTTITVRNGSLTSSVVLTISKDPASEIKSITITPEEVSLTVGSTQRLSVIALMGDDSLKDLTGSVTETVYTSSNSSRAVVDSEGNITIPANATLGTATITVKNGKFSKSVVVRVVK
ncbi:Ig-like domain-containing protein [Paenibacillus xylanexedens]|uniref:Ig-like domain-containing protein n=1 Tax=Paenibacillus xylanexedens TaxID=528191 RepID=UPI0011A15F28|nr:Ig-like domain-containing protein [Paenibacillus xylanexedens]